MELQAEIEAIKDMIKRSSPQVAANLLSRFEQLRETEDNILPFDELIFLARQKTEGFTGNIDRAPSVTRQFFEPFEALLETQAAGVKNLAGFFPRNYLKQIWIVVSQNIAPQFFELIEPKAKAATMCHDIELACEYAEKMRSIAYDIIRDGEDDAIINKFDKNIPIEIATRFVRLLEVDTETRSRGLKITDNIANLPDADFNEYVALLKHFNSKNPKIAHEFLLCLMGNTSKPWHVLRLLKTAFPYDDDRKFAVTNYNVIGERLLGMMEKRISIFEKVNRAQSIDGEYFAVEIENYNQISVGIERSNALVFGGPWTEKLKNQRAKASQLFNEMCNKAETALEAAFPLDKGRLKGLGTVETPRTYSDLNPEKVSLAIGLAMFIRATRLFAPNAGFGGAREKAHKAMLKHCDKLKNGMLVMLKQEDKGKYYDAWTKYAIEIVAYIEDASAAKSFERRFAA